MVWMDLVSGSLLFAICLPFMQTEGHIERGLMDLSLLTSEMMVFQCHPPLCPVNTDTECFNAAVSIELTIF